MEQKFNNELKCLNAIHELLERLVGSLCSECEAASADTSIPENQRGEISAPNSISTPAGISNDMVYGVGYIDLDGLTTFIVEKTDGWLLPYAGYIYDQCSYYGVEPILVLAKIQHEQSALYKEPSDGKKVKLLGYGVTEEGRTKNFDRFYAGVENQIKWLCRATQYYLVKPEHRPVIDKSMSSGLIVQYGAHKGERFVAKTFAEAVLFHYTPRVEELDELNKLWYSVYEQCKTLGIAKSKDTPEIK